MNQVKCVGRPYPLIFLKAVLHKFLLVHSWMFSYLQFQYSFFSVPCNSTKITIFVVKLSLVQILNKSKCCSNCVFDFGISAAFLYMHFHQSRIYEISHHVFLDKPEKRGNFCNTISGLSQIWDFSFQANLQ